LCVRSSSGERVWYTSIMGLPNKVVIVDGVGFSRSGGDDRKLLNALIANSMITAVVSGVPTLPVGTAF
jgi:hypothetical protein